jgi:hypothetical protein
MISKQAKQLEKEIKELEVRQIYLYYPYRMKLSQLKISKAGKLALRRTLYLMN